jgi:hypothetical protein
MPSLPAVTVFVIVTCPHNAYDYAGVGENVDVETVRRVTYFEAAYSEIWRAHGPDFLTNMLRTLDAHRVSYSPTRVRFVVLAGLINIELLGLQDGYLVGEMTNVNYEQEAFKHLNVSL